MSRISTINEKEPILVFRDANKKCTYLWDKLGNEETINPYPREQEQDWVGMKWLMIQFNGLLDREIKMLG